MTKTNAQTKTVSKTTKAKSPRKPATRKPAAAKKPEVDPDTIVVSKPHKLDGSMLVQSAGGEELILKHDDAARLLDYIGTGKSFAVAKAQSLVPAKGKAQLARGIKAKDAQQSAKAVADQNRGAKATNKADAATQKPGKSAKATAKAEKLAKDDARKITFVAENPKRPGSASFDRFAKYKKGMTVAQALEAGVTRADIDWDSKRDFIKFA